MQKPSKAALQTWLIATLTGIATMLLVQRVFKDVDPLILVPISQGAAFWVAWMSAWPLWFRHQPGRRFGLFGHSVIMLLVACVIVTIRVVWRLG